MFPFKIESLADGQAFVITLDKSEANVAVDDSIFKFPGKPADATPKP